ncbi:MAG TPA: HAMP domain-containing sensor histidine kinase [Candidatus Limnocylindrales bacterium]|nr:HAMP domain-containing sensor histidine kinase [Candidatus Limnocylindrales bacterium]
MAASPARGRRSLAWRLGLLLGIAVIAVLLLVGVVVNRVVSSSYQAVLTEQQQQRLDDAADTLADRLSRPAGLARAQALVTRLADALGGEVRVVSADGTTLAAFGHAPDGDAATYTTPIVLDGTTVATLEADIPARAGDRGFLPVFNATLAVAGVVSVLVIVLLSTSIAGRLTRPLRDVATAARRLEAGDATARATGGDDRESSELAEAFNAMADRLERSEMLRRRAASDIAHDLATPATVLESQLQAMIDGVVPTDNAGLEAARSAAAALGGVVADIDDLARAEAAPLQARPAAVDLTTAIPDIALAVEGSRRDRSARLEVGVAPGTVAWADPGHLARAVRNVIANALVHSPTGGVVAVSAGRDGSVVRIRVSDQGPGIAPDDIAHVFERFYRADTARATDPATGRPTGLGLGLTIARELLAANGGRIGVEQTGPDGTTFVLEVPAAV